MTPPSRRWAEVAEQLQRGFNHALSNRLAGLAALVAASEPEDADLLGLIAPETEALEELLRLMRLVPRVTLPAEPIRLEDVLSDCAAVWRHHAGRDRAPMTLGGLDGAPPLRCRVQPLLHALLVLADAATGAGGPATVQAAWDDVAVTIGVGDVTPDPSAGPGAGTDDAAATAETLLADDGAFVWAAPTGRGYGLRLPTLAALRARPAGASARG